MFVMLLLAGAIQAGSPTSDAANMADLRCFAALAAVTDNMTANVELAAAAMFYVGRIDGRTPGYDLEAGLRPLMTQAAIDRNFEVDLQRCGHELAGRRGLLGKAGKSLQASANAHPGK